MNNVIVYTAGVWDLLHVGHVHFLERAASFGTHLVVGVCSDRLAEDHGKFPVIGEKDRRAVVQSLHCVSEAHLYDDVRHWLQIVNEQAKVFAFGWDYGCQNIDEHQQTLEWCGENGVALVRLKRTEGISTTKIKERMVKG